MTDPAQPSPPVEDARVPEFWGALGLPGLADVHVHFLPPRLLRRVWEYFDAAGPLVGTEWPIRWLRAVCWNNAATLFDLP